NHMYPNLGSEVTDLIARVEKQPVELSVLNPDTGQPIRYTRDALVLGLHQMLLLTPTTAQLPYLIHRAYQGDWSWAGQGSALPSKAEWKIMNLTILCHEDWARTRRAETDRLSAGSYLGYADVRRYLAPDPVCALMPHPQPEALYQPVTTSPAAVLIISDEADPQNPPENVAGAPEHYPNSLRLVAPGQGHGYTGFACRDQILADFIAQGAIQGLNADCLQREPLPPLQ
ncbi:MAG TPA: alpha/beta hydrolase, partial [Anaerolineales bacterium]